MIDPFLLTTLLIFVFLALWTLCAPEPDIGGGWDDEGRE